MGAITTSEQANESTTSHLDSCSGRPTGEGASNKQRPGKRLEKWAENKGNEAESRRLADARKAERLLWAPRSSADGNPNEFEFELELELRVQVQITTSAERSIEMFASPHLVALRNGARSQRVAT